ncbi:hypothetical protein TWF481_002075 [Arthrobotrys musiformis]|uniref:NACHT domain-containing protein n=1 Tax=Arthrobotrys musiformis TaxID=47236 RepID=A0AAV9VSB0_9PEZI
MNSPETQGQGTAQKSHRLSRSFFSSRSKKDSKSQAPQPATSNSQLLSQNPDPGTNQHAAPARGARPVASQSKIIHSIEPVLSATSLGLSFQNINPATSIPAPQGTTSTQRQLPPAGARAPRGAGNDLWAEAINRLPEDEQNLFKQANLQSNPGVSVVSTFTKQIEDLRDSKKSKEWKIQWGPHKIILRDIAEKILVWLKTFKEVGDIAIQYDPVHAALPWAAVRFILQMAVSNCEARDAIFVGTEQVIRMVGRFAAYEQMYLGFKLEFEENLKKSLVGVYEAILRFLIKSRQFFEASKLKKIVKAVFPPEYAKDLDILRAAEEATIKDINVAKSQKISSTIEDNSSKLRDLNGLLKKFDEPISRIDRTVGAIADKLDDQLRGEALEWASTINHNQEHSYHVAKITPGTCTWLHNNAEFLTWRKSSSSALFWLKGDAGFGKTVLTASVIKLLLDEGQKSGSHDSIAYFYCDAKANKSPTNPTRVIGSLLKQIASLHPSQFLQLPFAEEFQKRKRAGNSKSPPSFDEAKAMIYDIAMLQLYPSITIIIDAMDECEDGPGGREVLVEMLIELVQTSNCLVKVFLSSRPNERDLNISLENAPKYYLDIQDTSVDLSAFIDAKMEYYMEKRKFLPRETKSDKREGSKMEVVNKLKGECHGMFLWADLQMKHLCTLETTREVTGYLSQVPEDLKSTYKYILDKIKGKRNHQKVAITAFQWMIGALRSLRPGELLGAIREKTQDDLSLDSVLDICRNLLVLDAGANVVRFIHLSFLEFLQQEDGPFEGAVFKKKESIEAVTMDCLSFLEAADRRCAYFDPAALFLYWAEFHAWKREYMYVGPERSGSLGMVDLHSVVEMESRGDSLSSYASREFREAPLETLPSLEFSVFVWEQWALQLRGCTDESDELRDAVKRLFGTPLKPSEALTRLVDYGALISECFEGFYLKRGSENDAVSIFASGKGLDMTLGVVGEHIVFYALRRDEPWNGFVLFGNHESFRVTEGIPSPLFLASYIGIGWYIRWLNDDQKSIFKSNSKNGPSFMLSSFLNTATPMEARLVDYRLFRESFETIVDLPGFSSTTSETIDFLYLARANASCHPDNLESWISSVSTIVEHHGRFNVNPFLVSRWALNSSASVHKSLISGLSPYSLGGYTRMLKQDVLLRLFKILSDVDLYPADGIMEGVSDDQEGKKKRLFSWLIYGRTGPEGNNGYDREHRRLTKYQPTCPLYVAHIYLRLFSGFHVDMAGMLGFWLDNGVDPNEAGSWGTLGHLVTAIFLRDETQLPQMRASEFPLVTRTPMSEEQFRGCMKLLVTHGADLNLRHTATKETIFEYVCRLKTSRNLTSDAMEVLLSFEVSITRYAVLAAINLDKEHSANVSSRIDYYSKYRSHEYALMTLLEDALNLDPSDRALETLEQGLHEPVWGGVVSSKIPHRIFDFSDFPPDTRWHDQYSMELADHVVFAKNI